MSIFIGSTVVLLIVSLIAFRLVIKWKRLHDVQKKLFDECFGKYEALDEDFGKLTDDYTKTLDALTKMYQAIIPITFRDGKELPLGNETQKERDELLGAILTARKVVMDEDSPRKG